MVSLPGEPDQPESAATTSANTGAEVDTLTTGAGPIATETVMARLSSEHSGLTSQPGAAYFRTIARIGAQVADALAYAHAQGICHRDIKPSNLLLDASGIVWVADFGLAKAKNGDGEGLTHTGDIVGTLRYMAPERFNGWADAHSDVYALGTTLYEMLTLRPAFNEHDRLKLIDRISHATVPSPRSIDPTIPSDLETVVLKAMARETSERYISARALAEDLERFLADRTILARRSSARERAWRWCRCNPVVAGLSGLAATLAVLIAIVSTVALLVSIRQLERTTKAERESRVALGGSLLTEGAALEHTGLIGQRFDSLDRLSRSAKILAGDRASRDRLPEIRRHAITALGLTDLRVVWERDLGTVHSLGVDAALERYAVAELSGAVVVYRIDNHRELFRLPAAKEPGVAYVETMFSADGELLVVASYGRGIGNLLQVWHLERGELVASLQSQRDTAFFCGTFSPDSRRLLFCHPEGGIAVWDRGERQTVRRLSVDFMPHILTIDPEGRRVACNSFAGPPRIAIIEIESGRVLADWRSRVGNPTMAWSADGQLLAIGCDDADSGVFIWNVCRGELASVLLGHASNIRGARFVQTAHLLATTSWDGMTHLWDAASGELLVAAPGTVIGFAPDGRRLAYRSGGKFGVWEIASGDECRTLHSGMLGDRSEGRKASTVTAAAFSPDGRLLATADGDGARL